MTDNAYKAVWVATAPRTGSMWVYFVTRQMLAAGGIKVVTPPPSLAEASWPDFAGRFIAMNPPVGVCCVKTHGWIRLDLPRSRFITVCRDIRDTALSYMRFMHVSFETALSAASTFMRVTDHYFGAPDEICLKLRHDDIDLEPMETAAKIARFLGLSVEASTISAVIDSVTRDRVASLVAAHTTAMRETIRAGTRPPDLQAVMNPDRSVRFIEPKTGFQTGHITSASSGEWRRALTPEQQARLNAAAADWLGRYGYPLA